MSASTVERPDLVWQTSLLAAVEEPQPDPSFAGADRRELAHGCWVEHVPGWLSGGDELFTRVLELAPWGQRTEEMYGERVLQPRLTAHWGVADVPTSVGVLAEAGRLLGQRYGTSLPRIGINLYRDGRDSVAWHGDRIAREMDTATIAILSVGHARPLKLRPRDGGPSLSWSLGRGDLFVMGGTCQRTWKHAVPKVADALPRISITFRQEYAATYADGTPGRMAVRATPVGRDVGRTGS